MANEAHVSLIGFVATQPKKGRTKGGTPTLSMRVGWTPRSLNRDTGQWSDLPSSFLTVNCFRKVAEHASVCLRKGEPVVVRGTLRIREYDDHNGVRRSTVEIQAESIGHDMSRGISNYTKLTPRTEMTAEEYEQSQEAGRNPLPGDVAEAGTAGAQAAGDDSEQVSDDDGLPTSDTSELELAAHEDEEFDESDRVVPASADELEPIGALA